MTGLSILVAEPPDLVVQTRNGDVGAFAALVERYRPIVFRWAIGLLGDEDEAEDVTHATIAATLPLRQREVFILCDIEGRTPAEVAALLDMKDVSVRASLFKARASIWRTILATHPCYREPGR
jgi:DNA-directed RNA polymerase specialized sigma24 family protein